MARRCSGGIRLRQNRSARGSRETLNFTDGRMLEVVRTALKQARGRKQDRNPNFEPERKERIRGCSSFHQCWALRGTDVLHLAHHSACVGRRRCHSKRCEFATSKRVPKT